MPYAITLPLDDVAAAKVAQIQCALTRETGDTRVLDLGYPPHVTLAVLPDETAEKAIEGAMLRAVGGLDALPLSLAGLGIFPGEPATIWAAPAVTERLVAIHARLIESLSAFAVHPHSRVGAWVPHVTLCQQAQASMAPVLGAAVALWEAPIESSLDRIELVRFSPVVVLRSAPLGAPADG